MPREPHVSRPSAGPRVTLVEDDRETQELLRGQLEEHGFEVTVVSSGLRLISALQVDRPDLLLLDVAMPWMDGFELCRALKASADFADIPVVFLSARADAASREQGRSAGCADYIAKPFELDQLLARIRSVLARDEGATEG